MTKIVLETWIGAPAQICFDLSRNVGIHLRSTEHTQERVISGRTEGLFELNDIVTWEAVHFGMKQRLTVQIIKLDAPHSFEDKMLKGAFKSMHHIHSYKEQSGKTLMLDEFRYEVPYGWLGKVFDRLVLRKYMTNLLIHRNKLIKEEAERLTLTFLK